MVNRTFKTPEWDEHKRQIKDQVPDEADRKNIVEFIKTYDMTFPYPHVQSIQKAIEEGIAETKGANSGLIHTTKRSDGEVNKRMVLPEPFVRGIENAYPYLFTSKVQTEWFLKNFPAFDLMKY